VDSEVIISGGQWYSFELIERKLKSCGAEHGNHPSAFFPISFSSYVHIPQCTVDNVEASFIYREKQSFWKAFFVTTLLRAAHIFRRDGARHPTQYETWDGATFGDMPDLCHRAPFYTELINYARWLSEEIGFDGFRYDMV
jgi:hypothetical protein